jgi:hypothetical protein
MQKLLISLVLFVGYLLPSAAQEPKVMMKTTKAVGETINLMLVTDHDDTLIAIDFGDGTKVEQTIGTTETYIKGTVGEAKYIKIYGDKVNFLSFSTNGLKMENTENKTWSDLRKQSDKVNKETAK